MRIIAGPCQHESLPASEHIARTCKTVCDEYGIEYYFKASYDKANRTHANSARGLGLDHTLQDFMSLKHSIPGLRILTDVHTVQEVYRTDCYPGAVDVLQIPAFLCRQTDLIQAASETGRTVNVKKGQFLAPWDVEHILTKTGDSEVWITERGTSFGYNSLVVDFTGLDYMLNNIAADIVFDVTHSVQKPGGLGGSSGGNRQYVPGLCRAGAALGVRNFFMEVHEDPDNACSDGPNMLYLKDFETVVKDIATIATALGRA